jgi:hypothetical protein
MKVATLKAVLLPVFLLIALTLTLLFTMGRARVAAVASGAVRARDIALGQNAWPDHITQLGNSYRNQFELPLLFYVLVAFAIATEKTDIWFVVLEWAFVALRCAHAFIHVTSNKLAIRFRLFLGGASILSLMWALFAARILLA